jgi:hypothetical protein
VQNSLQKRKGNGNKFKNKNLSGKPHETERCARKNLMEKGRGQVKLY